MVQRLQIARSSVSGQRPATRPPGELYVNFPDRQLGVALPSGLAQDLIAVPFYNEATGYAAGAIVRRNDRLLRALEDIPVGTAFAAASWGDIEGGIPVSGVEPPGAAEGALWVDLTGTHPELRRYVTGSGWQRVNTGYLALGGGTLSGALTLPVNGGAATTPSLGFGADGLAFAAADGLQVIVGGAVVARTHHDAGTPTAMNGDDVVPTRRQGDARWLRLAGGTLTGDLVLAPGTPPSPQSAASKAYVDGKTGGATVADDAPTGVEGGLWYEGDTGILHLHDGTAWRHVGGAAKLSLTGGALTGHLTVPEGATGAQVPRADAVLPLSGGTMTGKVFFDRVLGLELPQSTAGNVRLIGDGTPLNGIRFRFGGTGGTTGALALTAADSAWMALTPSAQSLETSTRLLQIVGGLRTSEEVSLYSELLFHRDSGPSYISWPAGQDLTLRRGGTSVALIGAGGTAAAQSITVMTREKGDERFVQRSGAGAGMTGALKLNGQDIVHAGRVTFSAAGGSEDYVDWVTGTGLRGYDASALAFEIGPAAVRMVGVYADTDSSAANVFVSATGQLRRSTSSAATKTAIEPLAGQDMRPVLAALNPVSFASRLQPQENGDRRFLGFIAEEIAAALPPAAQDDGANYDVRAIVAVLTEAVRQAFARLDQIEASR